MKTTTLVLACLFALFALPPVSDLNAAEAFTKVSAGPGGDVGNSRGAAWGDYDDDGFIDLFVPNIGPGGSGPASHFLYHNNGDGTFNRLTNGSIAEVISTSRGGAWGDYDNDGHLDLVLPSVNETNHLFHNNGDGSFAAIPEATFATDLADSRGVAWVDYDNDGHLDLFRTAFDQPRRLYQNNHDGTFTRITQGDFLTAPGFFFGIAWGDYNNDGRPDLFLPQASEPSRQPDYLYRNDAGGALTRVAVGMVDGNFNSSAAAWGDYDNDGDLDLFVSCARAPGNISRPNLFYRNDGNDTFTGLTTLPANDPESEGGASWGCTWGDYDNDGWLDLFVANRARQNDFLYHNNGDGTFTKVLDSVAVNDAGESFAAAWGDYDNDGFLDLFVGQFDSTNLLYHNNGNDNHWLKFRLIGTRSNRAAIGAKVRVRATISGQSIWQMREVSGGDGTRGQNSLHVHVGLGDATNADLVRIEWPSGAVQELTNVASKQFLTVTEPGAADIFTKVTVGPGSDAGNSRGGAWGDYDNDGFIDLFVPNLGPGGVGSAVPFLYHNNANGTFSRITNGPVATVFSAGQGAAWGDYNNDGHLDLVLMNINQPNYLFQNNGGGSFAEVPDASFVSDIAEHRSVTWVDYDNDGYVDLFSTTGLNHPRRLHHNNHDGTFTRITQGDFLNVPAGFVGVAWGDYNNDGRPDLFLPQANEPSRLPSYLYQNDGGGTFTRVGTPVLDGSANAVAAAWGDYDNDGDFDLFVSCSWFPAGPTAASRPNFFYRNDGDGTFTSLSSLPANDPENQGGASTGCTWGDYDNDGWLDLYVANYFGQPNFLYHNNGDGTFTKVLDSVAVIAVNDGGNLRGTAWGDYDNDGFLDLFVSNRGGTNCLYHNNGNDNHWLKFRLIGTRSNRAAIGAKVRVRATINGQTFWQMREVHGGDGTMGQNSLHIAVGLGDATNANLVRIEWPSGAVQELPNVASKQFLTVTEPGGEPRLAATRENGQVQLTLTGKKGPSYRIETSTALPNWNSTDLTITITNESGSVTFPAPGATSDPQRFYRAVLQ